MKYSEYYLYRYLVRTGQLSFEFEQGGAGKVIDPRERVPLLFKQLEQARRLSQVVHDRKCLLYLTRQFGPGRYLCKFAREATVPIHKAGDIDIERIGELDFPYVYLVVDTRYQALLLQKKTTVFRSMALAKAVVGTFLARASGLQEHQIVLYEITDEREFWESILGAAQVYLLGFRLKSPNLFGLQKAASEFLKELRESVNQDELAIEFRNPEGRLKISPVEWLVNLLGYVTGGGGSWILKLRAKPGDNLKTIRSADKAVKFSLCADLEQESEDAIQAAMDRAKIDS